MAISEKFTTHPQKSEDDFPFSAMALYWRVFEGVDRYLKDRTLIDTRYHGPAAKFMAGLWLFYYEHDEAEAGDDLTALPFETTTFPLSQLSTINRWIDQDLRLHISTVHSADQSLKLLSILRMGQISQTVKKIITRHQMAYMGPAQALNDNS